MHYEMIKFLLQFSDIGHRFWLSAIVLTLCFLVYFVLENYSKAFIWGRL